MSFDDHLYGITGGQAVPMAETLRYAAPPQSHTNHHQLMPNIAENRDWRPLQHFFPPPFYPYPPIESHSQWFPGQPQWPAGVLQESTVQGTSHLGNGGKLQWAQGASAQMQCSEDQLPRAQQASVYGDLSRPEAQPQRTRRGGRSPRGAARTRQFTGRSSGSRGTNPGDQNGDGQPHHHHQ